MVSPSNHEPRSSFDKLRMSGDGRNAVTLSEAKGLEEAGWQPLHPRFFVRL